MSKADSQALTLLAACESGLLTMQKKGIHNPDLAKAVDAAVKLIRNAHQNWPGQSGKKRWFNVSVDGKNQHIKTTKDMLQATIWQALWCASQASDDDYPPLWTLTALSSMVLTDLYTRLKNRKKKALIEPIFAAIEKVEDWFSSQKMAWDHYAAGERIVMDLYRITQFQVE